MKDKVLRIAILLSNIKANHERTIYNMNDLIGDLGGVLQLFAYVFGLVIYPISQHSYFLKKLEKLYLFHGDKQEFF
jgi:hypothetical protein